MKTVKKGFLPNRRQVIKAGFVLGAGMAVPWRFLPVNVFAEALPAGGGVTLSDPALQPKFAYEVPDALSAGFKYQPDAAGKYKVTIEPMTQYTGLVDSGNNQLPTNLWGYGDANEPGAPPTWPGKTFEIQSDKATNTVVTWENNLVTDHLLPVDTNLHWCYSLHGYTDNTIEKNGVPVITHLHGGHTDWQFDGNPEFFYGPKLANGQVVGPQWARVDGGFTTDFVYDNDVPAGNLWYHDHALGITRLNVYAGLAGFYFVRDKWDTGKPGNPLGLPAGDFEKAYAIQDRMFTADGQLFYPAYFEDPFYGDFISTDETGVPNLPEDKFPPSDGYGPTALAEFFGDHMVVNGKIWPYQKVFPANYRFHLLNGTDSRFMVIRFRVAANSGSTDLIGAGDPIKFYVIGSDQGLAKWSTRTDILVSEPGSRYDIVFDFKGLRGKRIIMENLGGDAPFGGDYGDALDPVADFFPDRQTDRIMAFDVEDEPNTYDSFHPAAIAIHHLKRNKFNINKFRVNRKRKVALFEGMDEFGRLQPLLGTAEPAKDWRRRTISWPNDETYRSVGLTGPMEGSIAWHSPTTENPKLGHTEVWEIWNITGDAHPVHLHLVSFDILGRQEIRWDRNADMDGFIPEGVMPRGDGIYLVEQTTVQHNSKAYNANTYGKGFKIVHPRFPLLAYGRWVFRPKGFVENAPKDMVIALPGQITRIKMTFDKPGRYVWHCHILSHEDHEMMRVLHVGPGA